MYKEYKGLNLPEIDKDILNFWNTEGVFEKSVEQRDPKNSFVFYEGPPSANGLPGIHHVMARTIKDIFCRFQTLNGKRVERKGGWDTHGLPIELAVEKELGITKEDIGKKISVDDYNHKCRETVMRYKDLWDDITVKMGYWVDLDNPYVTYENSYIESVWFLLKRLYDKGYLYKGYSIQPYSPAAGTGLSSHELNMPGTYKDVTDTTVVAMFKVCPPAPKGGVPLAAPPLGTAAAWLFDNENEDVRILAWTTTPWTLPSNTALAVGGNIDYVKIKTKNPYTHADVSVVLALPLVSKWFGGKNQPTIEHQSESFKGEILRGIVYEQLLDFGNEIQPLNGHTGAFKIITDNYVTTEDGTGVVHTAPSFGGDDRRIAAIHKIGDLTLVDKQGKFIDSVGEFSGRYVKNYKDDPDYIDVNVDIAVKLKLEGYAFNVQKYVHTYPHCWRTDKPILYYPLDSWFIAASKAKDRMFELNQTINWKPASTGDGRFGKWLENLQDWNLSRSRYWGIGLPIWRTAPPAPEGGATDTPLLGAGGQVEKCIGSIAELQAEIDKANTVLDLNQTVPQDMHRPYIDEIILVSDDGRPMKRELDLIDVWFDSGSMPYAQWGQPPLPPKGGSFPTWATANPATYKFVNEYAKKNRKNPTISEAALWEQLRGKKLEGFKFRRQHQIDEFIVDFICLEKRLVIEIDGSYHETQEAKEYDDARTSYLTFNGYKVVRFNNKEVLGDTEGVVRKIEVELAHRPTLTQADIKNGAHLSPPFGGARGGLFPADFIAEGVDQTRGWFYTLHAIAVMAYDSVAFKNVVSNGLVQDKDGQKMSKSKGNAVEPFETIAKYGADATRWYMISNAQPWDNLKFDLDGITEVRNKFFGTLYNTYNFFAMYANVDGFQQDEMNQTPIADRIELDKWVLSKLHSLVAEVTDFYATYEPTQAARAIEKFVDNDFSNWYVRLSRRRFWKGEMSLDKKAAYETMYECLMVVGQLASPIAPFFSDWLYKNLTDGIRSKAVENNTPLRHPSVHLTNLTKYDNALIDKELEQRMDYAQRISSLILSLRKRENIAVRQPLSKAMLPILDLAFINQVEAVKDLILSETNVLSLEYIIDTHGVVTKRIKPNFKTLGKILGSNMKYAQSTIESLTQDDIFKIENEKGINLEINGTIYPLSIDDFLITSEDIPGLLVASDGFITVALDIIITDELKRSGEASELVNQIQRIRKEADFDLTDPIEVGLGKQDYPKVEYINDFNRGSQKLNIQEEVLAKELKNFQGMGLQVSLNRPLIEKVIIHNFKSIEKANVPLSHLNILIGGNGAGKSNFISFFKLVQAITEGRLQDFVNYDIGSLLRFGRKSPNIFGGLVFGNTQTNHKNAIGFYVKPREKNENGYIQLLVDRYNRGRGDATNSEAINTWDEKIIDQNVDETTLMERKNDYRVNYVLKYLTGFRVYHFHDTSSKAPLRSPCDKENNRLLAENGSNLPAYLYYLQVQSPKVFKKIEGVVRLVAPFFDRFDLEPNRSNDKIELRWREKGAGIDDYFNAHYLSDGMLRFIALATLLLQPEEDLPKTIIIDEPELGLHPSAIGHLAEMLKAASQKCQVIVATQSIELVNYFEAEDIIAVDRINRTEGTTFKRFKKSELAEWLEEYGMGELWEKNVIGGNP